MTALSISVAQPQDLEGLNALNDQILENPQNVDLNLRYAHAAEELGKLRLALAAYERVLINEPQNVEARRGYERIRRTIEPAYTTVRTEIGARWDSNATNATSGSDDAWTAFASAIVIDERPIGATRWRSIAHLEDEATPDFEQLNHGFLGVQTGPLLYAGPHFAVMPAIGASVATLDDSYYFDELNVGVTIEGKKDGLSYWARLRGGWRDYSKDSIAEDGAWGELIAGVSIPDVVSDKGALVLVPWVRWSDIQGSTFDFFNGGDLAPGEFTEYGLNATYNYQASDHLLLSAGALVRQREYSQTLFGGDKRSDTYVAPEVSMTVQNILPCDCGVRLSYQYRNNDSNDPFADFDGQQVALSFTTRF